MKIWDCRNPHRAYVSRPIPGIHSVLRIFTVNVELMRKALEKLGNPNVLVNLVSRRVKQLNGGGGGMGRPLVSDTAGLGVADIAMIEIIEDKIHWEPALDEIEAEATRKRRRRGTTLNE